MLLEETRAPAEVAEAIAAQRAVVAAAQARLAELALAYAELRTAEDEAECGASPAGAAGAKPGEFVADELSVMLAEQPWEARLLLARTRRVRSGMPTVHQAARDGVLDAQRVRLIDRAGRLCAHAHTLAVLDEQVVQIAWEKTPKQLKAWLDRFLATHEPEAFTRRHRRAYADRRVTSSRSSATGMGYVTGEVSAADALEIDLHLTWLARDCGAADPRTEEQRRADIFSALLRGQALDHDADPDGLEVEIIDPDTGEYLGTRWVPTDHDEPAGTDDPAASSPLGERRGSAARIGIVVPLSAMLGIDDRPGELADRSGCLPAELIRDLAAQPGSWCYRLLTDDRGQLLDVTELGRFPSQQLQAAVRFRTGSCAFPTCTKPAELCDIDHLHPAPDGPTTAANLGPQCRRHHRAKTFAGLACHRDDDATVWTLPTAATYRCLDEPLPSGMRVPVDFIDTLECPDFGESNDDGEWSDSILLAELIDLLEVAA